ncbi:MAG: hypothetical protein HQK58_13665, partial [Deltaproteobacteria bacterium]|nr:hypothetical protein [Deltaproteobacteria bacterium]
DFKITVGADGVSQLTNVQTAMAGIRDAAGNIPPVTLSMNSDQIDKASANLKTLTDAITNDEQSGSLDAMIGADLDSADFEKVGSEVKSKTEAMGKDPVKIKVDGDTAGLDESKTKVDGFVDGVKKADPVLTLLFKGKGSDEADLTDKIQELTQKLEEFTSNLGGDDATLTISFEDQEGKPLTEAIKEITDAVKKLADDLESEPLSITVDDEDARQSVDDLKAALDKLEDKTVTTTEEVKGKEDLDTLLEAIKSAVDKTIKVVANVIGKDAVDALKASIDALQDKTVTVTVKKVGDAGGDTSGDSSGDSGGEGGDGGGGDGGGGGDQLGGLIERFARGGWSRITGRKVPGIGQGDTVKALLEPGEYVVNSRAVRAIGVDYLEMLNKMMYPRFALGGTVPSFGGDMADIFQNIPTGKSPWDVLDEYAKRIEDEERKRREEEERKQKEEEERRKLQEDRAKSKYFTMFSSDPADFYDGGGPADDNVKKQEATSKDQWYKNTPDKVADKKAVDAKAQADNLKSLEKNPFADVADQLTKGKGYLAEFTKIMAAIGFGGSLEDLLRTYQLTRLIPALNWADTWISHQSADLQKYFRGYQEGGVIPAFATGGFVPDMGREAVPGISISSMIGPIAAAIGNGAYPRFATGGMIPDPEMGSSRNLGTLQLSIGSSQVDLPVNSDQVEQLYAAIEREKRRRPNR